MRECDVLLMLGTDFPYQQFFPESKDAEVAQVDILPENLGRRTRLSLGIVGDVTSTLTLLLPQLQPKADDSFLRKAVAHYQRARWELDDLAKEGSSQTLIHPQYVAKTVNRLAAIHVARLERKSSRGRTPGVSARAFKANHTVSPPAGEKADWLTAGALRPQIWDVQQLRRLSLRYFTAPVVTSRCLDVGMACQLLRCGNVRASVKEVADEAATKIVQRKRRNADFHALAKDVKNCLICQPADWDPCHLC